MVGGFPGNTAPLLGYGTDHFGLEAAHHILRQAAENITIFLNSLTTDQCSISHYRNFCRNINLIVRREKLNALQFAQNGK